MEEYRNRRLPAVSGQEMVNQTVNGKRMGWIRQSQARSPPFIPFIGYTQADRINNPRGLFKIELQEKANHGGASVPD
jgi:hypothetical protein